MATEKYALGIVASHPFLLVSMLRPLWVGSTAKMAVSALPFGRSRHVAIKHLVLLVVCPIDIDIEQLLNEPRMARHPAYRQPAHSIQPPCIWKKEGYISLTR